MKVLDGAGTGAMRNEMRWAAFVASQVIPAVTGHEPVLTHANSGRHMDGSLHYKNRAIDLDWPPWDETPGQIGQVVQLLRLYLGDDYDVVPEKTHLHIEHDPK